MIRKRFPQIDWAIDIAVVALLLGGAAAEILTSDGPNPRWADMVAAVVIIVPLCWRRDHSRIVAVVIAAALVLQAVIWESTDLIGVIVAIVVAVYSVASFNAAREAIVPVLLLAIAVSASILTDQTDDAANIPPTLLVFVLLPYVAGRVLHRRHTEFTAFKADVDARTAQAVAEERLRIARDLHDAVAHNISVIAIQTDAALAAIKTAPDRAVAPIESIQQSAREAITEMQRMLVVLRDDRETAAHSPPPGLNEIPALIEQVSRSGVDVELRCDGERRNVEAGVGHCAYRVVQEGLTNAIKHASGADVEVVERFEPGALVVCVEDRGGDSKRGESGGMGLIGLRERVGLFGGTLDARATPDGWMLSARLPVEKSGAAA
ncbi:MAG: histidine kinase [Solirubrobacterales bacterium]